MIKRFKNKQVKTVLSAAVAIVLGLAMELLLWDIDSALQEQRIDNRILGYEWHCPEQS